MRCAGEAIGLRKTLRELQLVYSIRLWTDASAARGLALRTGGGKIKHMQAKYYWLQECIQAGVLTVEKIRGAVSPADLMTKHLNGAMMRDMCGLLDLKFEAGRAATAPKLEVRQRLRDALCETTCGSKSAPRCQRRADRRTPREPLRDRMGDRVEHFDVRTPLVGVLKKVDVEARHLHAGYADEERWRQAQREGRRRHRHQQL